MTAAAGRASARHLPGSISNRRSDVKTLQPPGWQRPKGYSNGIVAEGRLVFVAGQIGWDAHEQFPSDDFVDQTRQALANLLAVLAEAGAGPQHVVRLTWYITDREEYLARGAEVGAVYRELMGRHFPVMAMVQVVALMEARAKVEIEATAVLPAA
jgi:enamine deaminase RidA (YjgF/YER057c/UK114 family)